MLIIIYLFVSVVIYISFIASKYVSKDVDYYPKNFSLGLISGAWGVLILGYLSILSFLVIKKFITNKRNAKPEEVENEATVEKDPEETIEILKTKNSAEDVPT